MTPWLSLSISMVMTVLAVIVMRRMIIKRTAAKILLEEVKREIGAILTEMNQTTERNIELIEDRISALKRVLDEADSKARVLKREIVRHNGAAGVYSQLGRKAAAGAVPLTTGVQSTDRQKTMGTQVDTPAGGPVAAREEGPASVIGDATRAGRELAVEMPAIVASTSRAGGTPGNEMPGKPAQRAGAVPVGAGEDGDEPMPPLKERVLGLYHQGLSMERIASRVGTTVSEIELIVSLGEGR